MVTVQSNFLQALGWAVFDSVWQMAMLWICFQLITGLFKKVNPVFKNSLATLFLFTGFAWFVYTFVATLLAGKATGVFASVAFTEGAVAYVSQKLTGVLPYVSFAYLVFLLIPLFHFYRNYRYVQSIRTQGLSKADLEWRLFTQKIAACIGIKKKVTIWVSNMVGAPLTIGYWKPVILLPVAVVNHLSPQQIETILLHELAHIRRFDYLLNLLSRAIHVILYFNPFVNAFIRIQETEREKAADELVLQFQYDRYGYASALLALQQLPSAPLTLAANGGKHELLHRVEWIMGIQKKNTPSVKSIGAMVLSLLLLVSIIQFPFARPKQGTASSRLKNGYSTSPVFAMTSTFDYINSDASVVPAVEKNISATGEAVACTHNTDEEVPADDPEHIAPEQMNPLHDLVTTASPYMQVSNVEQVIPLLSADEQKQVEQAMAASKKVIADIKWKEVEASVADAMTSVEKTALQTQVKQSLNDAQQWQEVEKQMKLAYESINWTKVNQELQSELYRIKLDSLQAVYDGALAGLNKLKTELVKNKEKGIPDTDITVKDIDQQKKKVQIMLNTVIKTKSKKVVEL